MNSITSATPVALDDENRVSPAAAAVSGYGDQRRWTANIAIDAVRKGDRTRLQHLSHKGPLRVQRPFYPEEDCCHIYLLHPPGGLVSGDQLSIDISVAEQAHTLITTPSAGKLYRGDSCSVPQSQQVNLKVKDGICEWLPQETILFDGALGNTSVNVDLQGDARFIGWEIFCLGRPASELPFEQGWFRQQMNVHHNGELVLFEKQDLAALSATATSRWGFNNLPVSGTFVAYGFDQEPDQLIRELRERIQAPAGSYLSLTSRMGVLIGRYLGDNTEQARQCFTEIWQGVRPALIHKPATLPRIWMT